MYGIGIGIGMARGSGESLIPVPSPLPTVRDYENVFGVGWGLTALTVNEGVAPDYEGTDVAAQTRSDATTGAHGLGKSLSLLVSGVQYYADLVLKPDGRDYFLFQISSAGLEQNAYAMIDLINNTHGSPNAVDSVTVSDLSNGWKFVRMAFTATASVQYACNIFHAVGTNVATDFGAIVGDLSKGLLLDRYILSREP